MTSVSLDSAFVGMTGCEFGMPAFRGMTLAILLVLVAAEQGADRLAA